MSAIYNRRAGTHDANTSGETKIPPASQPVEKSKNYGHKIKSQEARGEKARCRKKEKVVFPLMLSPLTQNQRRQIFFCHPTNP
jgi:hypothetical protein